MITDKAFKAGLLTILGAILILSGCSEADGQGAPSGVPQVGDIAPNFRLNDLDGEQVSLSDFQGKPVLINFWATWCQYCREEMPYLQQIYNEWSDKGLVILLVNIEEEAATARQYMQGNNFSLPVLLDSRGAVTQLYGIGPIPTTFFIDSNGIIQDRRIGSFPNAEVIENSLTGIIP